MNVFKSQAERRVEAFTWGALLVWVGASLIVDLHRGVPSLVAGLILLTSAIIQRVMGWEAGIILWAGGFALSISGLNDLRAGHRDSVERRRVEPADLDRRLDSVARARRRYPPTAAAKAHPRSR